VHEVIYKQTTKRVLPHAVWAGRDDFKRCPDLCHSSEGRYPTTENQSKSPGRHKSYNVEAGARAPGNL